MFFNLGFVFSPAIVSNKCGDGWEYDGSFDLYAGRCYNFRVSDYKGWSEASYQCRIEGGDLASISDYNEQGFIAGKAYRLVMWINCVYTGWCYNFRVSDYEAWSEASYQCRIEGSNFTSIYNEQTFLSVRLSFSL